MKASIITPFKPFYFAGETAIVAVESESARQVSVVYGNASLTLTKEAESATYKGKIETSTLIGETHYTIFETDAEGATSAIAHGSFIVRSSGRSKYRDVVAAIDEAIKTYGTNPNKTINVGELSITYKDLNELLGVRSHYLNLAQAEEQGKVLTGGLGIVRVRF